MPVGEYGVRLTHISRAEPDPTLFRLPSDYKVLDRAILGVNIQALNLAIANQLSLKPFQGVLVRDVAMDTPAFRADLETWRRHSQAQ